LTLRSPGRPVRVWESAQLKVGGVPCIQEMVLVPAQDQNGGNEGAVLRQLMTLITSGDIRYRHQYRLERQKTKAVWFATRRGRRSFAAVLHLIQVCTTEHLTELLRRRWITITQLEGFMQRTPLSTCHVALIELAIRREHEHVAELNRSRLVREQSATAHSSGTGMTGELRIIANGSDGSHKLRAAIGPARYRRGRRVSTPV